MIRKECKHHGEQNHYLSGTYLRCMKCSSDAVTKRRRKLKQFCIDYKGGSCSICGYSKCNSALEFHHLNPNEKDFSISKDIHTKSENDLKTELDKCILVCRNCHAEIHNEV